MVGVLIRRGNRDTGLVRRRGEEHGKVSAGGEATHTAKREASEDPGSAGTVILDSSLQK